LFTCQLHTKVYKYFWLSSGSASDTENLEFLLTWGGILAPLEFTGIFKHAYRPVLLGQWFWSLGWC